MSDVMPNLDIRSECQKMLRSLFLRFLHRQTQYLPIYFNNLLFLFGLTYISRHIYVLSHASSQQSLTTTVIAGSMPGLRSWIIHRRPCVVNLLDGNDEGLDMTNTSFMLVARFTYRFHILTQSRYSIPRTARKHPFDVFECDLNSSPDNQNWMSHDEFLCKYRMNRDTLDAVTNLIKEDPVFQRGQRGPPQLPVKHQLMIFMHFIGREGETNANQRSVFHVSQGRCQKARERVILALTNMREEYIYWPDVNERKRISRRIEEKYHLPNCVGMMDGTLLELGITPRCNDKADYSGRKFRYSLTVNVINNDKRRIRAYLSGYPGTTHDNRVWRNMVECQRSNVFFSRGEYLVTDTAYEPIEHVVPAFKSSPGTGLRLSHKKQMFNMCLSLPRVTAEHTMGL